jgi:hypothetical protein
MIYAAASITIFVLIAVLGWGVLKLVDDFGKTSGDL